MDEFKDINSLSASLETPDLMFLQNKAIESATGFSMPASLHYETNTDGDTLFKSNIGAFGQLGLNSSYNFNTKETNTSVKVPFPLCPLFTKEYDLSMNTDAGVTTSFGVGPFSVSTKDRYSDPSISIFKNNGQISFLLLKISLSIIPPSPDPILFSICWALFEKKFL